MDAAFSANQAKTIRTLIPARLDRLPWSKFHRLVVVALGITWVLDGLEVTLAGAVSPALKESPQLHFSNADVGLASSAYLAGAVLGALFFTITVNIITLLGFNTGAGIIISGSLTLFAVLLYSGWQPIAQAWAWLVRSFQRLTPAAQTP